MKLLHATTEWITGLCLTTCTAKDTNDDTVSDDVTSRHGLLMPPPRPLNRGASGEPLAAALTNENLGLLL